MQALQGEYYFFERDTELFPAYQLNDRDAIEDARRKKTALIKFVFDSGREVKRKTLYDPKERERGARHETLLRRS